MFGVPTAGDTIAPPDMNRYFTLASADLVVPNEEAWRLLWDFTTLHEISSSLPGNTALQNKAVVTANTIMNAFNSGNPSSIAHARKIAEDVFGKGWQTKGADIYAGDVSRVDVWGIGHCHIDTAWLWPFRVTQQKVARSWSTQVDLMNRYPEHRFAASQAQQYKWLEQLYPKLFERVKEKITSGQFHVVGGSWVGDSGINYFHADLRILLVQVENDSNMPSGEARGICQGIASGLVHVRRPRCVGLRGFESGGGPAGGGRIAGPPHVPAGVDGGGGRPSRPAHGMV